MLTEFFRSTNLSDFLGIKSEISQYDGAIEQYPNYGGYEILVQKVFERDLSRDGKCKKLKF